MIGQDECTYKQFVLVPKQWTLPDGTTAVNPKDEGMSIMLLFFVSCDFGYRFPLSQSQLDAVNAYRRGKQYVDEDAANEVLKTTNKGPLQNSPFTWKFKYSINSSGFWNYNNMVIDFEDVVDVLSTIYNNTYQFLFSLITQLDTIAAALMD